VSQTTRLLRPQQKEGTAGWQAAKTRQVAIVAAALLVFIAPAARCEETPTKSFTVSGRPTVKIDTNDGSIHVATSPDRKTVEFSVQYQGYELGKNLHVDSRQDGDRIEITARVTGRWGFSIGFNSKRLHVEVRMPRDGDLQVQSGDGAIQTQALNGTLSVRTGDGSVRSDAVNGNVDIYTGDGSITLDGAKGEIKLHTGDGHIEARQLDGRVDASSGDGHIRIDGRFDALSVKTGDGSVDAKALPGSKVTSSWTIRTGDGSVDISLPSDLQADIDASTRDGRISLGIPVTVEGTFSKSQIHGKMNGGGQPVTIHTGDGSIRLSKS
jgi:Putative adhesin